jgi:hypothetical protein
VGRLDPGHKQTHGKGARKTSPSRVTQKPETKDRYEELEKDKYQKEILGFLNVRLLEFGNEVIAICMQQSRMVQPGS